MGIKSKFRSHLSNGQAKSNKPSKPPKPNKTDKSSKSDKSVGVEVTGSGSKPALPSKIRTVFKGTRNKWFSRHRILSDSEDEDESVPSAPDLTSGGAPQADAGGNLATQGDDGSGEEAPGLDPASLLSSTLGGSDGPSPQDGRAETLIGDSETSGNEVEATIQSPLTTSSATQDAEESGDKLFTRYRALSGDSVDGENTGTRLASPVCDTSLESELDDHRSLIAETENVRHCRVRLADLELEDWPEVCPPFGLLKQC